MAADQGEGGSVPPATEVERVFAEWEDCFQRHKQELQALRSPQQEYKAKVDAIDARISQWWAAYDEMTAAEKQQERDSLGLLFTEKSSLADQHQSTLEAQQAAYERRQREVFQRLHAAMGRLVKAHSPDGERKRNDAKSVDRSKDSDSQIEDRTRESESEAETVESIRDSEEEGHAVTPKGNTEKAMKRPRPDAELSPRETEEQNEEGRKRRPNRSSRFSTGGRFGMRTAERPGIKMRGQRGRPRGRPRGRGRGRGRSETMSGRTRSGGRGDEPTDDTVQETLGPGWRQVGSVFRHGPEPAGRRAPRTERDGSEEDNTYVRRAPGEVCLAYFGDNAVKTPILILPLNDMESIGISESLATLHLDEDMPKCCIFSSRAQKYQWARGYEDGGRLESNREYPVLCLVSSQLKKCPASWVAGSDMISIHDDGGWKLNHHYHEACDVLRKIKPRRSESPARNTENIQNDQNSTAVLEVDDSLRTSLDGTSNSNPEPETSTQPEIFPNPNGGSFSEETTSENAVHQNGEIEDGSATRNAENGMAPKNTSSSFSAEPGQAPHESRGVEKSYLENLAHTSLDYTCNEADVMEGGNIARERPNEQQGEHRPSASCTPIAGAQTPKGMAICQPHPTSNLQSEIQDSGISTSSETSYNVTSSNAEEGSTCTRAQIGEMFNGIERHMAERQIRVHWASGPANNPPHINSQMLPSQHAYLSPAQETNPTSTLPPLNPSSRTHLWLPPLTNRGGYEALSPHNTVDSAVHQVTTPSPFKPEYQAFPDDWRQFEPGPLRDDLDHWVRQYNRSPGIGSLMNEKGGFFCPFCPPTIQMTFPQPWDIVDHLLKVHPTGFWVRTAQTN